MDSYGTKFKTGPPSFIMEEMPIITSSPIEGKLIENTAFNQKPDNLPTWGNLLKEYQITPDRRKYSKDGTPKKHSFFLSPPSTSSQNSSSTFEPIAEHLMRVALSPNHKVRVISSSARKIHSHHGTPKPNKVKQKNHETVGFIKEMLKSKKVLTIDEINMYETILKRHIDQQQISKKNDSQTNSATCGLLNLIEDEIGALKLSPTSSRLLKMKNQEQEKRLVSLAITRRKSSSEIKRKISKQQTAAQEQIKLREKSEMKQTRASDLRKRELIKTTRFSQIHLAHHNRVINEKRRRNQVLNLQQQIQSEESKNALQTHKIVTNVWNVFLREQYKELQKQIQEQHKEQVKIVNQSAVQLEKLKLNYEEKLKELKKTATFKEEQDKMLRKEVNIEINKIQRSMRKQFQTEFQTFLNKIESKAENRRLIKEEKAAKLTGRLLKANYVYDV